jgi:hypothetical protein
MNYKLIKIVYSCLAAIILMSCLITMFFFKKVNEVFSLNLIFILLVSLSFIFFILKVLYDQKYPPNKTKKIIGYIIAFLTILFGIFGNTLIK